MPLAEHDPARGGLPELIDIVVSIHVPLAEHDRNTAFRQMKQPVSIHVPLAEHDVGGGKKMNSARASFNSRAPRGARLSMYAFMLFSKSFNSRAPRGARQVRYGGSYFCARVSIHVPLAEHDLADGEEETREMSFNSRAPRGARPMTA